MNSGKCAPVGCTPDWLREALQLRSGELTLDPPRRGFVDWIRENYGGTPLSV